ncbi:MAG: class II glutamine amidotransferase [Gammaproteobacteria bacterium]|nr:class II glutamine amidotransferase [Gammaproteobacteria bacterium]
MCGIAGLIHRGKTSDIGAELTAMLQALKHRGPDSTGFALYGDGGEGDGERYVMRFKVAEQEDISKGFHIHEQMRRRREMVDARMAERGAAVVSAEQATEYAFRYAFTYAGEMKPLADYIEDIDGAEILSIGRSLELVKDLGDAGEIAGQYGIQGFTGTHAIGHTRMATESDVDIRSAHPYWAYPFNDIAVVHNGQLTNYWNSRRAMERRGHRFMSNCDSELIAVYLADALHRGGDLEEAMQRSVDELDGVFTYVVATGDKLGMAKDVMAAKPMVLYESDDFVALASEEVAIRSIFPREIETSDPYEGEVRVWQS